MFENPRNGQKGCFWGNLVSRSLSPQNEIPERDCPQFRFRSEVKMYPELIGGREMYI